MVRYTKALLLFICLCTSLSSTTLAGEGKTAFDRIIESGTLRCGYAIATPWFMKEPNTEELSGYGYDVTMALAAKAGLNVEWVEETGWGVAEQGIISNRYDMLCGTVCIDPRRAKAITYSTPYEHAPILLAVRNDDTRFDEKALEDLNSPDVRIGVKTGHVFEFIANEQFPKAQKIYASDLSDDTEFFLMLETGKIDIAFSGQITIDLYNEEHENKIRSLETPARYCNGAYMMPLGDVRLKFMVDNALMELNTSGQLKSIMKKYMPLDPRYVRMPAMPFAED